MLELPERGLDKLVIARASGAQCLAENQEPARITLHENPVPEFVQFFLGLGWEKLAERSAGGYATRDHFTGEEFLELGPHRFNSWEFRQHPPYSIGLKVNIGWRAPVGGETKDHADRAANLLVLAKLCLPYGRWSTAGVD